VRLSEVGNQKSEIRKEDFIFMSSIIKSFEDLDVYRKAYRLSLHIHKVSLGFPKIEQYALGDQLRRASKSICANLAEGFSKQRASSPEFRRFLVMAIGSSDEMKVWISYSRDLGYVSADEAESWRAEYSIIARMLSGLANKWQ
jgi:four helix bundle protein